MHVESWQLSAACHELMAGNPYTGQLAAACQALPPCWHLQARSTSCRALPLHYPPIGPQICCPILHAGFSGPALCRWQRLYLQGANGSLSAMSSMAS